MEKESRNTITKIDVKGDNFYFWSGTAKYQIPSKMYPILNKKNKCFFNESNTSDIKNQELIDVIDSVKLLSMGHCYTNTSLIYEKAKERGIKLECFSGWVILNKDFPIHHAWLIYRDGETLSIIDSANLKIIEMVNEELAPKMAQGILNKQNWRKITANKMKELEKKYPLNHQQIVFGKASKFSLYIGSPSDPGEAKILFRELASKYPNHPSYNSFGQNINGASEFQKEYFNL